MMPVKQVSYECPDWVGARYHFMASPLEDKTIYFSSTIPRNIRWCRISCISIDGPLSNKIISNPIGAVLMVVCDATKAHAEFNVINATVRAGWMELYISDLGESEGVLEAENIIRVGFDLSGAQFWQL